MTPRRAHPRVPHHRQAPGSGRTWPDILDQPGTDREQFIDEFTLVALNDLRPWPTPPDDCVPGVGVG